MCGLRITWLKHSGQATLQAYQQLPKLDSNLHRYTGSADRRLPNFQDLIPEPVVKLTLRQWEC